jgi:hypothetical protein
MIHSNETKIHQKQTDFLPGCQQKFTLHHLSQCRVNEDNEPFKYLDKFDFIFLINLGYESGNQVMKKQEFNNLMQVCYVPLSQFYLHKHI